MSKKYRIVCFGDSLTWGWKPQDFTRFPEDVRWPGVLQDRLGSDFQIIEEGQSSRTINCDDPAEGEKNGSKYIIPCIESHYPFDMLIVMLGTNDCKEKFSLCSLNIMVEMRTFLEKVISYSHFKWNDSIKILLMSPPHMGENIEKSWLGEMFHLHNGVRKSKELAPYYKMIADTLKIDFMDAAKIVKASNFDSIHLDAENQIKLGEAVAEKVKSILARDNGETI